MVQKFLEQRSCSSMIFSVFLLSARKHICGLESLMFLLDMKNNWKNSKITFFITEIELSGMSN